MDLNELQSFKKALNNRDEQENFKIKELQTHLENLRKLVIQETREV